MYWQKYFSGFIQTMQFVAKQHNLTLKAMILPKFKMIIYYFEIN